MAGRTWPTRPSKRWIWPRARLWRSPRMLAGRGTRHGGGGTWPGPGCAGLGEMSARVRTYVSVPQQPPRNWEGKAQQQAAVYANRRRVEGERGKSLLRGRGGLLERRLGHQDGSAALR